MKILIGLILFFGICAFNIVLAHFIFNYTDKGKENAKLGK